MSIDRIVYVPLAALAQDSKAKLKGNGNEMGHGPVLIMPLRHTTDYTDRAGTGCDKWDDCITCPDKYSKKCQWRIIKKRRKVNGQTLCRDYR